MPRLAPDGGAVIGDFADALRKRGSTLVLLALTRLRDPSPTPTRQKTGARRSAAARPCI